MIYTISPVLELLAKSENEDPEVRRARNAKPSNRAARREYMKTEAGRAANQKAQENYKRAHPERVKAQNAARHEHGESGDAGKKCARSGCGKAAKHKHHPDYRDKTKVEWLCHEHHVATHHPKSDLVKKGAEADRLAGGRADGMSPSQFDAQELGEGIEHESEHTTDAGIAQEIAMDHLAEDPRYYSRLERTEKSMTLSSNAYSILRKSLYDGGGPGQGVNWFEAYRGTPFFEEALALEQGHLEHEKERKEKQKANAEQAKKIDEAYEAKRAANERAYAEMRAAQGKLDKIWEWDDKFYAGQAAKLTDLRMRYLAWLKKEASPTLVKSMADRVRHGNVAVGSGPVPVSLTHTPGGTTEENVTDLIKSLATRRLMEEFSKSVVLENTRPAVPGGEGMPQVGDLTSPGLSHQPMVEQPRPAVGESTAKSEGGAAPFGQQKKKPSDDDEVADAMDKSAGASCAKPAEPMNKAMIDAQVGPQFAGDTMGANAPQPSGNPGHSGTTVGDHAQSSQGMPQAPEVREIILSADDAPQMGQMQPRRMPLDNMVPSWSPPQLAESAGHQGVPMYKSQQPASHFGFMSPSVDVGIDRRAAAHAPGVELPPVFRFGAVMVSRGEDLLTKALTVGHGGVFGMMAQDRSSFSPQSPLTQTRQCGCCQKSVPVFLGSCPSCGDTPGGIPLAALSK